MLVFTLFTAALVVAISAWPLEDYQPTDATLQENNNRNAMIDYPAFVEEIEYKNIDSMVDRYPAFNQEKEYKDHEATADRYQAFAQVFGDLKLTVPSLAIGQTIEVVYINPPTGALSVNLVTASNNVALHFNPRYSSSGGYLVLNTLVNGVWQQEVYPTGFPFPAHDVQARVTVRITVRANDFLIQANGVDITSFSYRPGLSYDTVRMITWVAPSSAELESIKVTY